MFDFHVLHVAIIGICTFVLKNVFDFVLVGDLAWWVKLHFVLGALHTKDLKAVQLGNELLWSRGHTNVWICLHQSLRKPCTKVRSIDVYSSFPWNIHVLAPWAIHLDSGRVELLADSNRHHLLTLTEHSWTGAKSSHQILLSHHGQSLGRQNVTSMD